MIIGIAGGSRSGKTTLAHVLAARLECELVSLDNYFHPNHDFPVVYGRPDYDRMEAVDWQRAIEDISAQSRQGDLIVEGFLLLAHTELRSILGMSVFMHAPEEVRLQRRMAQPGELKTADDYTYITRHLPMRHNLLVEPTKRFADIVLDGQRGVDELSQELLCALDQYQPATVLS
ncbi:MAG TPA: AAA family ATPase [Candidatus Saccharimonadales bacterium]|jgi:uridine kinase